MLWRRHTKARCVPPYLEPSLRFENFEPCQLLKEGSWCIARAMHATKEAFTTSGLSCPMQCLLTQQVLNWLTMAGLFQYVMDSSGPLPATHMLEGALTALYGDYRATLQRLFWLSNSSSSSSFTRRPLRQRFCGIRSIGKKWTSQNRAPEALVSG